MRLSRSPYRRSLQGFSLVELMTVVAIIGILASIAIPNFLKYRARARQTEIKGALPNMYVAMKNFYTDQGSYSACLVQAGYWVEGQNYYMQGNWGHLLDQCGVTGAQSCYIYDYVSGTGCDPGIPQPNSFHSDATFFSKRHSGGHLIVWADPDPVLAPLIWPVTTNTFVIGGAGFISNTDVLDMWTINENKVITQTSSGL